MIMNLETSYLLNGMEHEVLSEIVFNSDYPGYKPEVKEIPNGDGKVDVGKRYAHIAPKYFENWDNSYRITLENYYIKLFNHARLIAESLEVPLEYRPNYNASCLRILYYPEGEGGNDHTDFDLFTMMVYRDQPDKFISTGEGVPDNIRSVYPQLHYGELMEEIGMGTPHSHRIEPSYKPQLSAVFFALPNHRAKLPSGLTVGEWLEERYSRSRK